MSTALVDFPPARIMLRVKGFRTIVTGFLAALALLSASPATAQTVGIRGDRLSGVVLPVEPVSGEITIQATRASAWTVDDTKRLWLSGDVRIEIAQFSFESDEAVVWLNRIPSADGTINQIALYFDHVSDPRRRAGMGATGNRLLVTGSTRGNVQLDVVLLREQRAGDREIVKKGEARLAEYVKSIISHTPILETYPQVDRPPGKEERPLVVGGPPPIEKLDSAESIELPPHDVSSAPLIVPTGTVSLNAGNIKIETGDIENIIFATDSLIIDYADGRGGDGSARLTLSSQRGVIFTKPGAISDLPSMALDAEFIIGIYLEGNVLATDGNYTVRGSRVYYDFQNQRAIMLDGVIRTYAREMNRPIYARAEEFRQIAKSQWTAKKAVASTSEFFTPHLAIGARNVTVTQRPENGRTNAPNVTHIEATNNTLELAGIPVVWFPFMAGTIDDMPLKSISMGTEKNKGLILKTEWDAYALFGINGPENTELRLNADAFTERGFGGGVEFEYRFSDMSGLVELYSQYDDGVDRTSTGKEIDSMKTFRGVALLEHQLALSATLDLQLQASYISDETYITTWRERDFEERREYETSLYLRNVDRNTAWTALLSYQVNDFISNSWLLASRQYTVDNVPDLAYRRYGDSLFGDRITYSSEYRASRVRMRFEDNSPEDLGIRTVGFGIPRTTEFDDMLRARGLAQMFVNRFDMRQEIAAPFNLGAIRTRPFLVGRVTAYDNDFDSFSTDSDSSRFFGAAGVTFSTEIQRVWNNADSRLFDIHRLRHIVEPSLTLWYGYSNVDQSDLPVFDEDVESLASGAAVRFGLRNTLQTQRGGPGFWHSVDVLTLDTALVVTSGDTDRDHPVPQFFEFRPEYSVFGDHVSTRMIWTVSDSLSVVGESIFDIDDSRIARGSIGVLMQHSPAASTYVEYRHLDASDTQLLEVGLNYRLTPKYAVSFRPQWDFRFDEFRSMRVRVTRSFPDFDFILSVTQDQIRNDTRVSATIQLSKF